MKLLTWTKKCGGWRRYTRFFIRYSNTQQLSISLTIGLSKAFLARTAPANQPCKYEAYGLSWNHHEHHNTCSTPLRIKTWTRLWQKKKKNINKKQQMKASTIWKRCVIIPSLVTIPFRIPTKIPWRTPWKNLKWCLDNVQGSTMKNTLYAWLFAKQASLNVKIYGQRGFSSLSADISRCC
jgi:hypothetical protein